MTVKEFEAITSKIKKIELPGLEAQFKLAPLMRKRLGKTINYDSLNPKKAAVMALVCPGTNEELQMVFMLRKQYEGVHSNQIGFPGGKLEHLESYLQAALRETYEEIGVIENEITVLRALTEVYIPPSNFLVQPYLGWIAKRPEFILEDKEVERLIEIPLMNILDDQFIASEVMKTSYAKAIEVPVFKFNEDIIWGATAMMLSEIKDLITNVKA